MPPGTAPDRSALAGLALFTASVPEVAAEIGGALRADLLPVLTEAVRRASLGRYLTAEQVQQEAGISARRLRTLRENREVTVCKRGRLTVYEADSVFSWIEAGRIEAKPRGET